MMVLHLIPNKLISNQEVTNKNNNNDNNVLINLYDDFISSTLKH